MKFRPALRLAAATLAGLIWSASALPQAYPRQPIRVIVPFAPGSSTDTLARAASSLLAERLGGSVLVENNAGGGGLVGMGMVARAAPDGYTLLFTEAGSLVVQPHLRKELPYDPASSYAAIAKVGDVDVIFAAHPKVNVNSLKEFIDLARANPDKFTMSNGGNGTTPHIAAEMLTQRAGIKVRHIPYKGGGPATTAGLSGEVDAISSAAATIMPLVRAGKLRALGIASLKRRDFASDVPTVVEAGLPDFAASAFFGMLAPAGVPGPVLERLRTEMGVVASSEEFKKRATAAGLVSDVVVGDDFARLIVRERQKWGEVIRNAGIKQEE